MLARLLSSWGFPKGGRLVSYFLETFTRECVCLVWLAEIRSRSALSAVGLGRYRVPGVTHTTALRGLQRGHGDVVGIGQLGMSRREGRLPSRRIGIHNSSSAKHIPTIDVTANSQRKSFFATSAITPVTPGALVPQDNCCPRGDI